MIASSEPDGFRVMKYDHRGKVAWELDGRWNLGPEGLVSKADRLLLAGARRATPRDGRVWELDAATGEVLRSTPGDARPGTIVTRDGWAWLDDSENQRRLHVLDATGDRVVATGDFAVLGSAGRLILAESDDRLRAFDGTRVVWERPGGTTEVLAADGDAIACGHETERGLVLRCYAIDGTERWTAGPFPGGLPELAFWNDLVIASGLELGRQRVIAVLDRRDGRIIALETGRWAAATVADDGAYLLRRDRVERRERREWPRVEDAWDPAYTVAVADQLEHGLQGMSPEPIERVRHALDALRAAGVEPQPFVTEVVLPEPTPDLTELRDAVAALRERGRGTYDPIQDTIGWLYCAADWPLLQSQLPDDLPECRVELVELDQRRQSPLWNERARIAGYPQLRLLSLMTNGLDGPLGIDLAGLPRLEYLSLSENVLERVPPELRSCRSLIHLDLRDNRLTSIEPGELPSSLRWLDVGKNRLSQATVARIRAALPDCKVESYAQRPADPA